MARKTINSLEQHVQFLETLNAQLTRDMENSNRSLLSTRRELAASNKYAAELELDILGRQIAALDAKDAQ